jgi:hypothetical protein
MSRWENAPDLRTLFRLTRTMVDLWCKSHRRAPKAITLDIDDTADTVHGHQQLSLFNARYNASTVQPGKAMTVKEMGGGASAPSASTRNT